MISDSGLLFWATLYTIGILRDTSPFVVFWMVNKSASFPGVARVDCVSISVRVGLNLLCFCV